MEALNLRQTAREFSPEKLPLQRLSNLLWAAFGVNRATGPLGRLRDFMFTTERPTN
jgi:hypothetical protein